MLDVTVANFQEEVVEASKTTPILVDFWATWCGPCKVIGPVLERLETEYKGRFKLIKIDADQEQQIAGMFGIQSIPTCVLVMNGQPVDGFAGAMPEGQIKSFLDKHLPAAQEESEQEASSQESPEMSAEEALAAGDTLGALEKFQHAVALDPANDLARFDYIRLLMQLGRTDDAKVAFAPVISKAQIFKPFAALQVWFDADDFANQLAPNELASLDTKIASNKRDFEARFARATLLISSQKWTDAMDELLEILMRDKMWNEEKARKTYIAILDLMEPAKVKVELGVIPPEDAVLASYRRRLSSVVLS